MTTEPRRTTALVIPVDGNPYVEEFVPDKEGDSCKFLKAKIAEIFSIFAFRKSGTAADAYCDDEGQLKGLPLNKNALKLVGYPLVGTVVVLGKCNRWGYSTSVPKLILADMQTGIETTE